MPPSPPIRPFRGVRLRPWATRPAWLVLLAVMSVAAACTSGEPEGQPPPPSPPSPPEEVDPLFAPPEWEDTRYGLHMDLTFNSDPDARISAIERAAGLGVQVSRNSFLWDRMQPDPAQDVDWSVPDSVVEELTNRGIEPMFTAYGSPSWASGVAEGTEDARMHVPQDDAAFEEWAGQYADLMRVAAERYRGQVTKWEVWNEQNSDFFWKPAPDIDRYVEFFQTVRAAIRQGNPEAQIAPGGLAALAATGGGGVTGFDWLQQMLDRGVRPDYVSIHPYSSEEQGPDDHNARQNNFDDIERVHNILVEAGHEVPVWVTEWGWHADVVGEDAQARYVARSLERIADDYPYVTVATYFVDHDRASFSQGLFDAGFRARPAADAFSSFMDTRR